MAKHFDTRANLIEAAISEFDAFGFDATNSNRIAHRAGYAPQTFYRHFKDKTAIFLVVYERLRRANLEDIASASSRIEAARIIVTSHRKTLHFRRSLRWLACTDRVVAKARAASRTVQISALAGVLPGWSKAGLAALLLRIERLADAIAEEEFVDLGVSEAEALAQLSEALIWLEQDVPMSSYLEAGS